MSARRSLARRILDDHHVPFFTGMMFVISGVVSLFDNVVEAFLGIEITAMHGLFFLGGLNLLMSLVFMLIGAKNIEGGLDRDAPAAVADFEGRFDELEAAVRALQGRAG